MDMYSKKEGNYKIYVTGHSLGGYIAQITGARIAQKEDRYDNIKLAKIVDFNAMGINFIEILGVLRLRLINTLKQLSEEGRLVEYSVMGDIVSGGGVHYGEIRNIVPSIDTIVSYREDYQILDSAQKVVRITSVITKLLEAEPFNIFKAKFDKARGLYQMDSLWAFLNLTHQLEEFVSLNYKEENVELKVTDYSENEIGNELEISKSTTIRAKTYGASAKTYKWYESDDGVNWGEPIKVSSLYGDSTVLIPTNTLDVNIENIEDGKTKYYKVESYYDDNYTVGRCKQTALGYNYFDDEEQPQDYNSGMKEQIIKVTRKGGNGSGIIMLKLTNAFRNIFKTGVVKKLISLFFK